MTEKLAYNLKEAAAAAGVSESTLRRAIANDDIIARYPTSKAVIMRDELEKWLLSRSTESPYNKS